MNEFSNTVQQVIRLQNFYDGVLYLLKNKEDLTIKNISDYTGVSKESIYRSMRDIV